MRRLLLITTTALVFTAIAVRDASAVIPVTCDNCVEFPAWVTQTAKELDNMVQQVNQLRTIYGTLSGTTNIGGIASALGVPLVSNPLSSVTSGSFNAGAVTGSLSALAQQFRGSDNYYLPNKGEGGFVGELLNGRADMLANIKAAATQLFDGSQERVRSLQQLQDRVGQATTLKEAQDLNNEIAGAETAIANQQGQLQQLALLANIQDQQSRERAIQRQYQADEAWANSTRPMP